MLYRVFLFHK